MLGRISERSSRLRIKVLALCTAVALGSCGGSVALGTGEPVVLLLNPKSGEVYRYLVRMVAPGSELTLECEMETRVMEKRTDSTVFHITYSKSGASIEALANFLGTMANALVVEEVDRQGSLVDIKVVGANIGDLSEISGVSDVTIGLPAHAIRVGESWRMFRRRMKQQHEIRYELREVRVVASRRFAVVGISSSGLQGGANLEGEAVVDVATGMIESQQVSGNAGWAGSMANMTMERIRSR